MRSRRPLSVFASALRSLRRVFGPAPERAKQVGFSDGREPAPAIRPRELFFQLIANEQPRRVLEIGTAQVVAGRSTHHMGLFPHAETYVRADIVAGADVDVVADAHSLPDDWAGRFEAFVAVAVFEHLARPWIAAREVARVLAPRGLCYVSTHQTFPLHAHPQDYFRFSREAVSLIFEDAGLDVIACDYEHRCAIVPPRSVVPAERVEEWNEEFPSHILVNLVARKP